jgi:uncharacterized Fe-S center protein
MGVSFMSIVYYGSLFVSEVKGEATLPGKLDIMLKELELNETVKGETVAIKMHLGRNVGYSTIHPFFVRRIVKAVKEAGGKPFVTDVWYVMDTAIDRGYTSEVLGCPIVPVAGPDEKYFYSHDVNYKSLNEFRVAGMLQDATYLIDLSHAKGHNVCGYAGAIKNLGLGGFTAKTRSAIHKTTQFDQYWEPEKCLLKEKHVETCPFHMISFKEEKLKVAFEGCNQCMRCVEAATDKCLSINPVNFESFQEACAISAREVLSTFEEDHAIFINVALDITPYCDCIGVTTANILPDIGILASKDIVAVEKATLDLMVKEKLITGNIPPQIELHKAPNLHHFQVIFGPYKNPYSMVNHSEKLGLGTTKYTLKEILPPTKTPHFRAPRFKHRNAS